MVYAVVSELLSREKFLILVTSVASILLGDTLGRLD